MNHAVTLDQDERATAPETRHGLLEKLVEAAEVVAAVCRNGLVSCLPLVRTRRRLPFAFETETLLVRLRDRPGMQALASLRVAFQVRVPESGGHIPNKRGWRRVDFVAGAEACVTTVHAFDPEQVLVAGFGEAVGFGAPLGRVGGPAAGRPGTRRHQHGLVDFLPGLLVQFLPATLG